MSIPIRLERMDFRLTAETPLWQREAYGLPESFVPGDGLVIFTIRPTVPGYHVHAVRLPTRMALFDADEGDNLLEQRALMFASEAYQQRYRLPIHKDGTDADGR